uniref:Uncharacterized protein n=1 Tax=viral metagenome TaxID=1070528 RepID=A0A6M3JTJ8_9ZZZZ
MKTKFTITIDLGTYWQVNLLPEAQVFYSPSSGYNDNGWALCLCFSWLVGMLELWFGPGRKDVR